MTDMQRLQLTDRIMDVARSLEVKDAVMLVAMLSNNPSIQKTILQTLVSFVTNEMKMQIYE